ncbi:hypothetical protein J6590_030843 [Homalodisca vitripennis]|nr:hypothetical protein J6590_030843 [Homalodisca vitripennis]
MSPVSQVAIEHYTQIPHRSPFLDLDGTHIIGNHSGYFSLGEHNDLGLGDCEQESLTSHSRGDPNHHLLSPAPVFARRIATLNAFYEAVCSSDISAALGRFSSTLSSSFMHQRYPSEFCNIVRPPVSLAKTTVGFHRDINELLECWIGSMVEFTLLH